MDDLNILNEDDKCFACAVYKWSKQQKPNQKGSFQKGGMKMKT